MRTDFDRDWKTQFQAVQQEITAWRQAHPKATLREIESEVDQQLDRLRSRLIGDTAMASDQTDWKEVPVAEGPQCPACHQPLDRRGKQERRLQSQGAQDVVLERSYGVCPSCGAGLFPPG
jgi:hypothetical protein